MGQLFCGFSILHFDLSNSNMTIKGYGTLFGVGYQTIIHDGIGLF
jgi:hypothetical protein